MILLILVFNQLTMPYQTKVIIDLENNLLIYGRYYQNELIDIDSVKSLSSYLEENIALRNRRFLLDELKSNIQKQGGGYANQGLFGTFEISLPSGGFSDFMGETGKLDVGGHVKITLGGSKTFVPNLPGMAGPSIGMPELEMKQEMAINLDGEVGDRMHVFIDHNSERIQEGQNKITVTYKGREDEILQQIEGGDTQLSIPPTTYTGDIPSHKGLFGLKTTAKVGPLDLVAIASNENTSLQEFTYEGQTQADTNSSNWAKYYASRRFFYLGTDDEIIESSLQIFVDDNNALNNNIAPTYYGHAWLDKNDDNIPDDTLVTSSNIWHGDFTLKYRGEFYRFIPTANIIELNTSLQESSPGEILGVIYTKIDPYGDTITVGKPAVAGSDTIQLKLICPKIRDTLSYTYNYELKNYYQVVSPGSRLDSLRIYYTPPSGIRKDRNSQNTPYLQVLGLDRDKNNVIDDYGSYGNFGFDRGRGLLIFPDALPFASDKLDDPDPEIYTNPWMQTNGKYYLFIKTAETRPIFRDLPVNMVDVKVYVDGNILDSTEYHVDYDEGTLELLKPIAPTSKVRIEAEYTPFFSAAQKSLIGMRGGIKLFGDANLGSSFFYRTESYPAEHTRLKEEPFSRMVWETDFAVPLNMPWLTKFVDWLPLIETEAASKMNINFEGAYSFSNLNPRGEVYLDDLESSTIISREVSPNWRSWVLAARPVPCSLSYFVQKRLIWFNPQGNERLKLGDIFQNPLDENDIAPVLKIIYKPDNINSFAGLTQYIYGENLNDCENLEVIINGKGGRVHIDLAEEISEDQLRRNRDGVLVGLGTLEDEDADRNGTWNNQNEDTGLDGIYGDDDSYVSGDDGNDDYKENDYTGGINGTEGNNLWDTEDIDHNGNLNSINKYYSYSIALDSTEFLVENAGLKSGWRMFRIPIQDSLACDTIISSPDWHNIKYVRIWFDGFSQQETLLVYQIAATGSRWKNYGVMGDTLTLDSTEVFTLTPVNTKTHTYFKSPYPTKVDPLTGEVKTEGGLELRLENIKEGHRCVAHRQTDEGEDYRAYDTLTFFLYCHRTNPQIAIKIGSDTANYYEYRAQYNSGSIAYNNYRIFRVSTHQLTELKKKTKGQGILTDSNYTVCGNPSLSYNQFFELTIENPYTTLLTDTIWFEDVKLSSPRSEIGRIVRGSGSINFADLASISVAFNESNGRFKRLSEAREISTQGPARGYTISSNAQLNKVLPECWSFNIPLTLNYQQSISAPRFSYIANDLEITSEEQVRHRSTSLWKSYALRFSKSNSKNWLLKNTLDKLSFEHNRSHTSSQGINNCDTSQVINYSATYTQDPKLSFNLLNQTISILPQSFSFSSIFTDNLAKSYYRATPDTVFELQPIQHRKTLNPSLSVSYRPHSIINTNFGLSQTRDSVSEKRRFGDEVGRNQSFNASLAKDLKIVSPSLSFNSTYNEDHRFEIRQEEDLRNVSNSGIYGVTGGVNLKGIVKFFTGFRDEAKDSLQIPGSPGWIAKQIEKFVENVQNPALNFSRQRTSNYMSALYRPEIKYQFGLTDSIPPDAITEGSMPGRAVTDNYGLSSGMNYRFVSLSGSYQGSVSRTFSYGANGSVNYTSDFPNANLGLRNLEKLPFLKKYSTSSQVTAGFNQSFGRRYDNFADSLVLAGKSSGRYFNPLISWQTNWLKGISSTIDVNYSETMQYTYSGNTEVPSKSLAQGGAASLAYTFSAPKGLNLPFLKGLRFSSDLSVSLGANYNHTTNFSNDLTKPTHDYITIGSNLNLSYKFSSSVTGGANLDYSQNKDMQSASDSKRVGVNIWANINF